MHRHRVTRTRTVVPSILDMLLTQGDVADSLRVVLLGGDSVGADLPHRLAAAVPGCRLAALGGATETAIHSTVCEVTDPPADWTRGAVRHTAAQRSLPRGGRARGAIAPTG